MKTSLFTLLLFSILLAATPTHGQQAEKTLVKSFNLKGHNVVLMDVEGNVQVTTWKQEQMRIQMTITLQQGTETILKSLVTAGRYNLESAETEGNFVVSAPGLEKQIKMSNGQTLGETVTFMVFMPENVLVKSANDEDTGFAEK